MASCPSVRGRRGGRCRPGRGLTGELDRDALARLHEQYRACGVRRREDTVYMRSIQPDFEVNTSRW